MKSTLSSLPRGVCSDLNTTVSLRNGTHQIQPMSKQIKNPMTEVSTAVYNLLEPLSSQARQLVVRAALTLLGENASIAEGMSAGVKEHSASGDITEADTDKPSNARSFFDKKEPRGKTEQIAAAARFRELKEHATAHTRSDIEAVFSEARRNFDRHNFARDLDNARNSGFFNKGGSAKTGYTLSYYGQNYVDALPDRSAARALGKPQRKKGKGAKKGGSAA